MAPATSGALFMAAVTNLLLQQLDLRSARPWPVLMLCVVISLRTLQYVQPYVEVVEFLVPNARPC